MAFAPSKDQLPQSLTVYLTKWLEVATKGHVVLHSHMTGATKSMTIFKCKCGQNWHVGDHLFYSAADPGATVIPSELSYWVKEHRHVCKKYEQSIYDIVIGTDCKKCNWPYGAHEESWLLKYQMPNGEILTIDQNTNKVEFSNGVKYNITVGSSSVKPKPIPPLPEPKGRKFR